MTLPFQTDKMTSGIMEYKGYAAFIHYSDEDEVFYGK